MKYLIIITILLMPFKSSFAGKIGIISIEEKARIQEQQLEVLKSKIRVQIAELKFKNNIE